MRLGDLDNLKEKIQEIVETEMPIDEKWAMGLRYSLKLIDSAPTVDAYPFEQVQELVKLNQQFAQEIEELKKPQGEWITGGKDVTGQYFYDEFICNQCFVVVTDKSNFCPKCGADMRKGSAE